MNSPSISRLSQYAWKDQINVSGPCQRTAWLEVAEHASKGPMYNLDLPVTEPDIMAVIS